MDNFSVSVKSAQSVAVIAPKGYVNDLGAEGLEHECERFLDKGIKKIIINFSDVQFINSIGASIFTGIVQKAVEYKGFLCFTNMKKVHSDVFEMLGIIRHVKVFREEKEALDFLKDKD
ncbi:MAG: STAS domain-containing protein [Thermodesulfovibrionales bacterium]|nr:STAS domain-containing protein [Thermodesulfovibrionales bacterium]